MLTSDASGPCSAGNNVNSNSSCIAFLGMCFVPCVCSSDHIVSTLRAVCSGMCARSQNPLMLISDWLSLSKTIPTMYDSPPCPVPLLPGRFVLFTLGVLDSVNGSVHFSLLFLPQIWFVLLALSFLRMGTVSGWAHTLFRVPLFGQYHRMTPA